MEPTHRSAATGRAPWMSAWGEDETGAWCAIEVGDGAARAEQRMRWIAPGRFLRGSPPEEWGRDDDEGPQHECELTQGLWLAETPCVQALWMAVMGENPSRYQADGIEMAGVLPVENLSFGQVTAFIAQLNAAVPGLCARLPTEAEWEYACRAGTTTATWKGELAEGDARALGGIALYAGTAQHPGAVYDRRPNPWGLHDMLGNVWEWCADVWTPDYGSAETVDPFVDSADPDALRAHRGGSLHSDARSCRAASRRGWHPNYRRGSQGFRLARGG